MPQSWLPTSQYSYTQFYVDFFQNLNLIRFDSDVIHDKIGELFRLVTSQEHSRAWYRIGATRVFSGSKKVQPQLSVKLREVRIYSINIDQLTNTDPFNKA